MANSKYVDRAKTRDRREGNSSGRHHVRQILHDAVGKNVDPRVTDVVEAEVAERVEILDLEKKG